MRECLRRSCLRCGATTGTGHELDFFQPASNTKEHDQFVLQDGNVVEAALDDFRKRPTVGFSDCLIVEIARKAGHYPVGTFDRSMSRLEGAIEL